MRASGTTASAGVPWHDMLWQAMGGDSATPIAFNDTEGRTKEEVLAVFDKAISKLMEI